MRSTRHVLQILAAAGFLLLTGTSQAVAEELAHKDLVLRGDAKCTRCHDESDDYPVLAIGQTRHGVKADSRTPSCTNCHGESERHMNKPEGVTERPRPERLFRGKNASDVATRNGACLSCHESGLRTLWQGSRHESDGVACTNCHQVHVPRDAVLTKAT